MSNRTLLEINHDFTSMIEKAPEAFVQDLVRFLRNPSKDAREVMIYDWHVGVLGTRHHEDKFLVQWGNNKPLEYKGAGR